MAYVYSQKIEDPADLWDDFFITGGERVKERLVVTYIPLVKLVIDRMLWRLPRHLSREDLLSSGVVGLLDAIKRFRPDQGAQFQTYAIPRIRGAILDELRAHDTMSRSAREKIRRVKQAVVELEGELLDTPSEDDIAGRLGMDVEDYRRMLTDVSPIRVLNFSDLAQGEREWDVAGHDETAGDHVSGGDAASSDDRQALTLALQALPKKEKLVISLYYYEEMTLKEIAAVLQVSEGRVSQIHTQALIRLRAAVEKALTMVGDMDV